MQLKFHRGRRLTMRPSCVCTKGDFDKVVKPGKSGKITLSIDKTEK
jgi:hypothetical protein